GARDRARSDLALRFIHHKARTQTILRWTGLTRPRVLELYNSYLKSTSTAVPRLTGRFPDKASFFMRTPRLQTEASVLGSVLSMYEITPRKSVIGARPPSSDLAFGQRVCEAYEYFQAVVPNSQITFEHAVLLVNELARAVELRLDECKGCGSLVVIDS